MKTPVYEASTGALEALLETNTFVEAVLYTYTLSDGTVLRYSAADCPVRFGGNTWPAGHPIHDLADGASWRPGLDVDTLQYKVYPRKTDAVTGAAFPDLLEGVPWNQAAQIGTLDGAVVEVLSAYAAAWPSTSGSYAPMAPVGVLLMSKGRIGSVDILEDAIAITVNDYRELLNVDFPRNLYGPGCRHVLFDAGCQLVASTYKRTGTVTSSADKRTVTATLALPSGFSTWALGRIAFTSGANAGFTRTIRSWNSGTNTMTLIAPLPFPMTAGDAFDAYPGCDRTYGTCTTAGNQANFGGQRFIPPAETAI